MTGGERLAKVAEVLASLEPGWDSVKDCEPGQIGWGARLSLLSQAQSKAQRFAPLLDTFRAEDEARALREAAEGLEDHANCDCEEGDHLRLLASPQWLRARADRIGGGGA